jgi:hypothetical protein
MTECGPPVARPQAWYGEATPVSGSRGHQDRVRSCPEATVPKNIRYHRETFANATRIWAAGSTTAIVGGAVMYPVGIGGRKKAPSSSFDHVH